MPTPTGSTDTGITRLRVTIGSNAAWVLVSLNGTEIDAWNTVATSGSMVVTGVGGHDISVWNPGSAVVDIVASVPKDAATSLSMCKNYLAPATVTIDRMTDGDVVVGSVTNSGNSPVVPLGSCENHMTAPLDRSALIGPVRWPARGDARPLVLADYFPWWDATTLHHDFGDDPVGPADTSDPATIASAVDLATGSGIDGFVVEYEGTPTFDPRIDEVYQAADQRSGFQVATMVDLDILSKHAGGFDVTLLDKALQFAAARAGHPSQLRVGDQPVVFVYDAGRASAADWSGALQRLRGATGLQLFIVSDADGTGSPARFQYGTNNLSSSDQLRSWAAYQLLTLRERPGLSGGQGPLWIAPVSPGFDDTRLGWWPSSSIPRAGGQRFDDEWSASLSTLPDWVLVTSWNEYYEQTHVMPGTVTGTTALQQISKWAAQFHADG